MESEGVCVCVRVCVCMRFVTVCLVCVSVCLCLCKRDKDRKDYLCGYVSVCLCKRYKRWNVIFLVQYVSCDVALRNAFVLFRFECVCAILWLCACCVRACVRAWLHVWWGLYPCGRAVSLWWGGTLIASLLRSRCDDPGLQLLLVSNTPKGGRRVKHTECNPCLWSATMHRPSTGDVVFTASHSLDTSTQVHSGPKSETADACI